MPALISLRDVVEALEMAGDQFENFLNPDTGEIRMVSEDDRSLIEDDVPLEELPEWQRESIPMAREVVESDKWLVVPGKYEIHEWAIMQRFVDTVRGESNQDRLQRAIHGKGAFRYFKDIVHELGIEKDWYAFREEALREFAREWLDSHGLKYQ